MSIVTKILKNLAKANHCEARNKLRRSLENALDEHDVYITDEMRELIDALVDHATVYIIDFNGVTLAKE